nr:MAG TPA: hypothetical protein [Caudoviricetes sp.]
MPIANSTRFFYSSMSVYPTPCYILPISPPVLSRSLCFSRTLRVIYTAYS